MNRSIDLRQWLLFAGIAFVFWCLLGIAFAAQLVFATPRSWPDALQASLHDWFPWAVLSVPILLFSLRFPLQGKQLPVSLPLHLIACVLAVAACEVLSRPFLQPQPPVRRFEPGPELDGVPPPFEPPPGAPAQTWRGARPPAPPGPHAPKPFLERIALRARLDAPIYWVLVSMAHTLAYYRRSQERERQAAELEAQLAQAKLETLRMQLHPHFLFNTLNAIATLVHKDPAAADEMIANLSELLRATLETRGPEVPLQRELDFLGRYLEIQQARFGDHLSIEKEIDGAALDGWVPALVLQPLVENAIRHGIEPQASPGRIKIAARREGNLLRLTVHDSGRGPQSSDRPGIGLANTRARLRELYGEQARLTLSTGSQAGFSVELQIPFHSSPTVSQPEPT